MLLGKSFFNCLEWRTSFPRLWNCSCPHQVFSQAQVMGIQKGLSIHPTVWFLCQTVHRERTLQSLRSQVSRKPTKLSRHWHSTYWFQNLCFCLFSAHFRAGLKFCFFSGGIFHHPDTWGSTLNRGQKIFLQFQEIWGRDCTYGFTVNIPDLGMANLNSFEITTLKNNITIETSKIIWI